MPVYDDLDVALADHRLRDVDDARARHLRDVDLAAAAPRGSAVEDRVDRGLEAEQEAVISGS